ncbi:hypothetical protein K501DRAFT_278894 [Backusella circina FSU 941]|nr:hypothetical protein K501DRAFT_278894 [Backusella circina FSU 941]
MSKLSSLRIFAIVAEIILIVHWIIGSGLGDFYTYLALAGVISVLSIYGLIVTFKKSIRHLSRYLGCLSIILGIHFITGWIHIILLFTSYHPLLMNTCLQRQKSRFFWWSSSEDITDPVMEQVLEVCTAQWNSFAIEKVVSWAVYSLVSLLCFCVIWKYHHRFNSEYLLARSLVEPPNPCKGDEMTEKQLLEQSLIAGSSAPNSFASDMYQQRQKLYDEISKRRRARKNINRRSVYIGSVPASNRLSTIHPLDFSQTEQIAEPAPTLAGSDKFHSVYMEKDDPATWYPENDPTPQKEKDVEREKRLEAFSTERMEYEMYRSDQESRKGSVSSGSLSGRPTRKDRPEITGQSRRIRPKVNRWSTVYHNFSADQLNNIEKDTNQDGGDSHTPLLTDSTREMDKEEEEEEEEENDGR